MKRNAFAMMMGCARATSSAPSRPEPPHTAGTSVPTPSHSDPPLNPKPSSGPGAASTSVPAQPSQPAQPSKTYRQPFPVWLVYDFESTCNDSGQYLQELIEFSCVAVRTETMGVEQQFQMYCKPTERPILTAFCTRLTGITQSQVDAAQGLGAVLQCHDAWLRQHGYISQGGGCGAQVLPITWTEWDLKVQLDAECKWRGIEKPVYLTYWCDLKAAWKKQFGKGKVSNLRGTLALAGLEFEGRCHSGLDDAFNTAKLAVHLARRHGVVFTASNSFGLVPDVTLPPGGGKQSKQSALLGFGTPRAAKKPQVYAADGRWLGVCKCGLKSIPRKVAKPGPSFGRRFHSCGTYSIQKGKGDCDFFVWDDKVEKAR